MGKNSVENLIVPHQNISVDIVNMKLYIKRENLNLLSDLRWQQCLKQSLKHREAN